MPGELSLYQHELVSDEIHEVISYRPHWIVRKGNVFFFLIILFLLSLTWFIKYPDIVDASAKLVAINPPKLITAKVEGRLLKLFVVNEQTVTKNQHLGYIESTASYEQVIKLQDWINKAIDGTAENNYVFLISDPLPDLSKLGELQVNYQSFENELIETKQILSGGYYQKKRNALEKDVQYLTSLKTNTTQQKQLLEQDQQLQQAEYNAYELLAKDKVIAPLELNQYKSKLIVKDQSLEQINAQITNSDISKHNKEKELLDLQKLIIDQQQKFHSALLDLKSQLEKWIQQYVLVASEEGKVLFVSSLLENEMVINGQQLFYIQPNETKVYAELVASQNRLGKIKTGQKVMMKVESYPSNEFGYLSGVVNYISNIPNRRDSFLIKVDLPKGLQTNYDKTIFFRNNLSAQAEIITDDRKLFERLVGQLKQIWDR
jgi:HlyD family secretion protein